MRSTELLVRSLVGLSLPLFCVVDLETSNGLMPAAGELMMLSRVFIMPGWCHWGRFVLARAEAQKVYGAATESHNERTMNTLKYSICSLKWWEALLGSIFGVKPSILAFMGPGCGLVVARAEKSSLMSSQFDRKQCRERSSHFVLFPAV